LTLYQADLARAKEGVKRYLEERGRAWRCGRMMTRTQEEGEGRLDPLIKYIARIIVPVKGIKACNWA